MKLFLLFFTLMCVTDTEAESKHGDIKVIACSDTDKEYMLETDQEEMYYADFVKQQMVKMLPPFGESIDPPEGEYGRAVTNTGICKTNLEVGKTEYKDLEEPKDVPQNSIYPRDDVNVGTQNTLICHSVRFFPPPVRVRWTKNGEDVTDKSSLSQYYPNEDHTFNQFSHLTFTPMEGDVYTCTVEHKSLETPDTKTWEVHVELPSVGPAVFCVVGLAVGLLGVATGTFFLVKGNQCN
ncbi:H-2 class II histocompatibility antigen, A-R alpha chain-like [Clarias gariepinus]|uniref:H-2 class II histocompatibility antigen, A-R alpha chain-like isoform X1 n=1 Tax=Clarias gariepinus TaxID=13013 RepID=UPI00234D1563|nr:H-2 class II histocompatibility antigen, A-R alpha chain-like isoform X1 [Clarias gariepinus]